jgi:hypothetical protein
MKITKKVIFTLFILTFIWACTDDAKQFLTDVDELGQISTEETGDINFDLDECIYETAWTDGDRYITKGNWATFTSYEGAEKTVDLLAGQDMLAGTVTFSAPAEGMVTITINFEDGWELQDVEEPLKVQDYAIAPTSKPSPGLFDWKSETNTIVVPENNFYGVHVDVQNCPPPPCNEWIVYGSNQGEGNGIDGPDAIYSYDLNAQTQTLVYDPTPIDGSPNYPNANAYDPVNQRIYCGTDDGRFFYYDIDDDDFVQLTTNGGNFGIMACGAWYNGKFYYVQNGTNRLYEVVIDDGTTTATRTQIGTVPTSNGYGDIVFDPANPGVFIGSAGSNPVWYVYDLNTQTSQILTANVTDNHKQLAYGSNGVLYAVEATSGQFYTVVYDTDAETVTLTADWDSGFTFTDLASGPQCQ